MYHTFIIHLSLSGYIDCSKFPMYCEQTKQGAQMGKYVCSRVMPMANTISKL